MTGRNFTFLADDGNNVTSQMPADETVVEALLDDGSLVRAWYSSNISEPGDWDFVPVEDGSDEPGDAKSIAARMKAWRPIQQGDVIAEIAAERARQVAEEGWTPQHDDEHDDSELAIAGALYALYPTVPTDVRWPWRRIVDNGRSAGEYIPVDVGPDGDGRKRHSRRKRLVIAGALIVAEIERLDRAGGGEVAP